MKTMPLLFSTLRRCPVLDAEGRHMGQLKDLILLLLGVLLPVTELVVLTSDRDELILPWGVNSKVSDQTAIDIGPGQRVAVIEIVDASDLIPHIKDQGASLENLKVQPAGQDVFSGR